MSDVSTDVMTLPGRVWHTKGFAFWTFLSLLLLGSGCRRILELGSGRSTITFAEYAKFKGARFISLESSREWYNKGKLELHFLNLPTSAVKLIEVDPDDGWYRADQFVSLTSDLQPVDCILIDGPSDGDRTDGRKSESAIRELKRCCATADLILTDDVHRRHILAMVEPIISNPEEYRHYYFEYRVMPSHPNSLCISVRKGCEAAKAIPVIEKTLNFKLRTEWKAEQCPEP